MYLAIDLGTTGCRSSIFDEKLNLLAYDYKEYPLITLKEDWVEQDANLWWKLTLETASAALEESGISGKEIQSISVSSQGITLVPVDKEGKPLMNAISWLDLRAREETEEIRKDFGEERIFSLTGKPISSAYTLPKLLWVKKHLPEIYQKAEKFLMPMDFLLSRMTGRFVTDYSMASGTLFYDLKGQKWSREILEHYGIQEEKLPEVLESGTVIGKVSPGVAVVLGLSLDCVVAVGAQDQKCAAYGVGLSRDTMTVSLGTAAAVTKYWDCTKTEENRGVGWCGYVEKDSYVTEGVVNTAGTCLRWVRDLLFPGEDYETMNREGQEALERGNRLWFYPYLAGSSSPHHYPESCGVFYGLNLGTKRGEMALSVMKGVCFQIRSLLDAMEGYQSVKSILLFGGGGKSELWCQLLADITGLTVQVPRFTEAASAGAARLGGKAVGKEMPPLTPEVEYLPRQEMVRLFAEEYKMYCEREKKMWEVGEEKV